MFLWRSSPLFEPVAASARFAKRRCNERLKTSLYDLGGFRTGRSSCLNFSSSDSFGRLHVTTLPESSRKSSWQNNVRRPSTEFAFGQYSLRSAKGKIFRKFASQEYEQFRMAIVCRFAITRRTNFEKPALNNTRCSEKRSCPRQSGSCGQGYDLKIRVWVAALFLAQLRRSTSVMTEGSKGTSPSVERIVAELETVLHCPKRTRRVLLLSALATGACLATAGCRR